MEKSKVIVITNSDLRVTVIGMWCGRKEEEMSPELSQLQ